MSDRDDASPDVPETPPAPRPAPAAPPRYDDEISLRDLYLIFRGGFSLIAWVTVLAAGAAYLLTTLLPDVYASEATIISAPTTISVQEEGALSFTPRRAIAFEAYRDIASRRATYEQALVLLQEENVAAPASFRELRDRSAVDRLSGPSESDLSAPLTVVHRVEWSEPALAARYADAWAQASIAQVRATLLADLDPTLEQTVRTIDALEVELRQAQEAFEAFALKDLDGARRRLAAARQHATMLDDQSQMLELDIARLTEEVASWADAVGSSVRVPLSDASIDLLTDLGRLDAATAARWRMVVPGDSADPVDVATLVATTELQDRSVELAGKLARHSAILDQIAATALHIEDLLGLVTRLEAEEREVRRRLGEATSDYDAIRSIEPALAFVAELTPSNTRVLNRAQEPIEPSGISSLLVALVATIVAFLATALFVFLREAVRAPAAQGG